MTFSIALFAFALASCSGPAAGTAVGPGNNVANTTVANSTNAPAVVPAGPAVAVTAQELGKEYQRDPAAFENKYKGKTLAITGNAILAGRSGEKFVIMLSAVDDASTSKSVSIECGTANSEQADELGKAVDAALELAKKGAGSANRVTYPGATIKGVYEYSPPSGEHGETMSIISLNPCELTAVTK
jgi:hypothetical protein